MKKTVKKDINAFIESKNGSQDIEYLTFIISSLLEVSDYLNFLSYTNKDIMYREGFYSFKTISQKIFSMLEDGIILMMKLSIQNIQVKRQIYL